LSIFCFFPGGRLSCLLIIFGRRYIYCFLSYHSWQGGDQKREDKAHSCKRFLTSEHVHFRFCRLSLLTVKYECARVSYPGLENWCKKHKFLGF